MEPMSDVVSRATHGKAKGKHSYKSERDKKAREETPEQEMESEEDSFVEAENPSELDFDEKDYVDLDFASVGKTSEVAAPEGGERLDEKNEEETTPERDSNVLTYARLKALTESLTKAFTTKKLKHFLMAFSSGVKLEDTEKEKKIVIPDTDTFQELMVFAFQAVPEIILKHLTHGSKKVKKVVDLEELQKIIHLLKNYISNYILFLGKLSDTTMIEFILSNSLPVAKFILHLKPYHLKLAKLAIKLWSESASPSVQLFSFILIREIAKENQQTESPGEYYTQILKKCYKGYSDNAKLMGWKNYDTIQFMRNCYVELCGIDLDISYQQAFAQIRKFGLDLRALVKQTLVLLFLLFPPRINKK